LRDLDNVFGTVLRKTMCDEPRLAGARRRYHRRRPAHLDPMRPAAPGDYARLITYTVDAFTHRLAAHLVTTGDQFPLPRGAPPDPDDEALFPPEPQNPGARRAEPRPRLPLESENHLSRRPSPTRLFCSTDGCEGGDEEFVDEPREGVIEIGGGSSAAIGMISPADFENRINQTAQAA
jgi:hypothetical protein